MDTTSRKILNALKQSDEKCIRYSGVEIPFSDIAGESEIDSCLRYLEKKQYINITHSTYTEKISLDYRGFHPVRWIFDPFIAYVLNHWIAVAALIISIVSIAMQLKQ